jgi:hypothetical protein
MGQLPTNWQQAAATFGHSYRVLLIQCEQDGAIAGGKRPRRWGKSSAKKFVGFCIAERSGATIVSSRAMRLLIIVRCNSATNWFALF